MDAKALATIRFYFKKMQQFYVLFEAQKVT